APERCGPIHMKKPGIFRISFLCLFVISIACGGSDGGEEIEQPPKVVTPEEKAALAAAVSHWKPRLETCCWSHDGRKYSWFVNAADRFFTQNGFEQSEENSWHWIKGDLTIETGESRSSTKGWQKFITIRVGAIEERFPVNQPGD
ncbi:MAG: hypothetical protein AAF497_21495, partial [Planctomycetota bacterium]